MLRPALIPLFTAAAALTLAACTATVEPRSTALAEQICKRHGGAVAVHQVGPNKYDYIEITARCANGTSIELSGKAAAIFPAYQPSIL